MVLLFPLLKLLLRIAGGEKHRFTTTDYVFVVEGVLKVLTPAEPFTDGKVTEDNVQVTVVKAGDVYIQRGTLHS